MKNSVGREAGNCWKMVSDRGDRCLFFLCCRRLFFQVFAFPVCKAQLIGDWLENRRGAPKCSVRLFSKFFWFCPLEGEVKMKTLLPLVADKM